MRSVRKSPRTSPIEGTLKNFTSVFLVEKELWLDPVRFGRWWDLMQV